MARNVLNTDTINFLDATGSVGATLNLSGGALCLNGTAIDAGISNIPLTTNYVFVGNASNLAVGVPISGDATLVSSGALTLVNASVTGQVLTGFTSGAGVVAATDTILQSIQKINGNELLNAAFPKITTTSISGNLTGLNNTSLTDLSGWTVTFTTTRANEVVAVNIILYQSQTTIAGKGFYIAYVLDGAGAVGAGFAIRSVANDGGPVPSSTINLTIASAGSHTFKLQYKVDASGVATVWGTTGGTCLAQIQVTQY